MTLSQMGKALGVVMTTTLLSLNLSHGMMAKGWQVIAKPWAEPKIPNFSSSYTLKRDIMTTVFWVGQGASGYNDTTNIQSAWDQEWTQNYGGIDSPENRRVFQNQRVSLPNQFAPTRNPFYVALPFNDVRYPEIARKVVPWWNEAQYQKHRYQSQCKGRWIMIQYKDKICFAQWEDVGPLRFDHHQYVFGSDRPTQEHSQAGLDVSPAVRDYLGLSGLNRTNWRFVDASEVQDGPWIKYAEQAILFASIKGQVSDNKTAMVRR